MLEWDIYASNILHDSKTTCKLKYTTLPSETYYYQDGDYIFNKTNIIINEELSELPKNNINVISLSNINQFKIIWLKNRPLKTQGEGQVLPTHEAFFNGYTGALWPYRDTSSFWMGVWKDTWKSIDAPNIYVTDNTISSTYSMFETHNFLITSWYTFQGTGTGGFIRPVNLSIVRYTQGFVDKSPPAPNISQYPTIGDYRVLPYINTPFSSNNYKAWPVVPQLPLFTFYKETNKKTIKVDWWLKRTLAAIHYGERSRITLYYIDGRIEHYAFLGMDLWDYNDGDTIDLDEILKRATLDYSYHRKDLYSVSNYTASWLAPIMWLWWPYAKDINNSANYLDNYTQSTGGEWYWKMYVSKIQNEDYLGKAAQLFGSCEKVMFKINDDYDIKLQLTTQHKELQYINPYGVIDLNGYETSLSFDEKQKLKQLIFTVREYITLSGNNYVVEMLSKGSRVIRESKGSNYAYFKSNNYDNYIFSNSSSLAIAKSQLQFNKVMSGLLGGLGIVGSIAKFPFTMLGSGLNFAMMGGMLANAFKADAQEAMSKGFTLGAKKGGILGTESVASSGLNTISNVMNADYAIQSLDAKLQDMKTLNTIDYSNDTQIAMGNYFKFGDNFNWTTKNYKPWTEESSRTYIQELQNRPSHFMIIKAYTKEYMDLINTYYKVYGWRVNTIIDLDKEILKRPWYDYIQIDSIVNTNIPAVFREYIIKDLQDGIWLLNQANLKDINSIATKDNLLKVSTYNEKS